MRTGVKAERPQRSEDERSWRWAGAMHAVAGCRKISGATVWMWPSPSRDGADTLGQGRIGPAAGRPFSQLWWAWSGAGGNTRGRSSGRRRRGHLGGSVKRCTSPIEATNTAASVGPTPTVVRRRPFSMMEATLALATINRSAEIESLDELDMRQAWPSGWGEVHRPQPLDLKERPDGDDQHPRVFA